MNLKPAASGPAGLSATALRVRRLARSISHGHGHCARLLAGQPILRLGGPGESDSQSETNDPCMHGVASHSRNHLAALASVSKISLEIV